MPHEHPLVPQQRGFYLGLLDDTRRFKKRKAMPDTPSSKTELVFSSLSTKHATAFELRPDAPEMTRIVQELGLQGLRKVRFTGKIAPAGKADWHLESSRHFIHGGRLVCSPQFETVILRVRAAFRTIKCFLKNVCVRMI